MTQTTEAMPRARTFGAMDARIRPNPSGSAFVRARVAAAALVMAVGLARPPWLSGSATVQGDPQAALARAAELLAKSDYEGAKQVLLILEKAPDLSDLERVAVYRHLATADMQTAQYDAALRWVDVAERLARRLGAADEMSRIEAARGFVWRARGHPLQAVQHNRNSLEWAERVGDRALVAQVYANLSLAYQDLGDWSRVLDYAERALEANPQPDETVRLRYLRQTGIGYFEFGDRDAAEQRFLALLALARRRGDRQNECVATGELALVYWEFDRDAEKALRYYDAAIALARRIHVQGLEANWLLDSGNVLRDTDRPDAALRRYHQALELERRAGSHRLTSNLSKNVGQVLVRLGRRDEAEAFLLRAADDSDRYTIGAVRWQSRMELGRFYTAADPARADRYFTESLDLLEGQHANVLLENFRVGAISRSLLVYDPYDVYVAFLLDRGETGRAFAVAERARARVFLDTLAAAREQIATTVPTEYLQQENETLQRISMAQSELSREPLDAAKRLAITLAVERDEEQLAKLRVRLTTDHPALAAARYPRLWTARELQTQVLQRGEALVSFFLGRDGSAGWIVRPDGVDVVRLPPRVRIEQAVRDYLRVLQNPAASDVRRAGREVSWMLGAAMLKQIPADTRLIIIPHGLLHYLPFEALLDEDGRYLVERYVLSYAPSASSYAYLRQLPPASADRVLAVGNPMTREAPRAAERRLDLQGMGLLKPLPFSEAEMRQIQAIFGRSSQTLERAAATELALQQASLAEVGILHFATHGLIDESRPERSGLALTAAPPDQDGLLQMREIYRLKLRAALVTLSACETALGKQVNGEGIVGLARAFFYAGANAVVASLWNINDASTAEWMTRFYERIRDGEPIDRAARDAKLAFLQRDSRIQHPFYWAAFVVTGQAAVPVRVNRGPNLTPAALAITLAALTVVVGYYVARARRRPSIL
ncbi:MAG: CHAT domain-containing protein [Acidobacteria bacterium]|nr:CHAT domain-containing protein [Acidobacteriota bacterium]